MQAVAHLQAGEINHTLAAVLRVIGVSKTRPLDDQCSLIATYASGLGCEAKLALGHLAPCASLCTFLIGQSVGVPVLAPLQERLLLVRSAAKEQLKEMRRRHPQYLAAYNPVPLRLLEGAGMDGNLFHHRLPVRNPAPRAHPVPDPAPVVQGIAPALGPAAAHGNGGILPAPVFDDPDVPELNPAGAAALHRGAMAALALEVANMARRHAVRANAGAPPAVRPDPAGVVDSADSSDDEEEGGCFGHFESAAKRMRTS